MEPKGLNSPPFGGDFPLWSLYTHIHTLFSASSKTKGGVRKVSENIKENNQSRRYVVVAFPGRHTGLGAWSNAPITTQGFEEKVEACNNVPVPLLATSTADTCS